MLNRVSCLICNGPTRGKPAKIARFLSEYCELGTLKTTTRYCPECDLVFFERRLTDKEASRLYSNYRGEEYNRVRLKHEPWYAKYAALFDDPLSPDYFIIRVSDYIELANGFPEISKVRKILDFGGDGRVPARAFPWATIVVDDLSKEDSDHDSDKFEMIFAAHVFEHLTDPLADLRKLTKRLQPDGLLFIDVPKPPQANLTEGLLWQERHGGELFEMHEHLTHFSRRSLIKLAEAAGLTVVFEYPSRYCPLSLIAVNSDSALAASLLSEKRARETYFEARMARDESRTTHARVNELRSAITGEVQNYDPLRAELDKVYKSTSWRLTAPVRAIGRTLKGS